MPTESQEMNNTDTTEDKIEPHNPERYAAIYARRSTKKEDNYSLEFQKSEAQNRCEKDGLIVYKIYEEKVSGKQIRYYERKVFMDLMNDLYSGMFKTIILYKRDRLTRRIDDSQELKRIFERHGIRVLYTHEPDQDKDNNYISQFVENMMFVISTFEPERISIRAEAGRKASRDTGKYNASKPAFGYTLTRNEASLDSSFMQYYADPKYVYYPYNLTWELVKYIYEKYIELDNLGTPHAMNLKTIKKEVNNELTVIRDKFKGLNATLPIYFPSKDLTTKKIIYTIKNPRNAGFQTKSLEHTPDNFFTYSESQNKYTFSDSLSIKCPNIIPLISKDLWVDVNLRVRNYEYLKITKDNTYFLKDKLRCKHCVGPVRLNNDEYTCKRKCTQVTKSDLIELILKKVVENIEDDAIKDEITEKIKKLQGELTTLQNQYSRNEKQKKELMYSYLEDKMSQDILEKLKNYTNTKNQIQKEINKVGNLLATFRKMRSEINHYKQILKKDVMQINLLINEDDISKFITEVVLHKKKNHGKSSISSIDYKIQC